jgi:GT2 family glycosyltransferase
MPRTTVAIVTWNGRAHIDALFTGLLSQGAPGGFDVVVVDNASRDGTPEAIEAIAAKDARVRVVRSGRNAGFAVGNNLALGQARGEYLVALNSDTVPEPGWLDALVDAADANPRVGSVASQMTFLHDPQVVQSAGIRIDRAGIAWDAGSGDRRHPPGDAVPTFGASAGAALYRTAMLRQLGGFDERFFMYLEDVDLAWRARLAGWEAVVAPSAVVRHAHSGSSGEGSPFKNWHLGRNKVWTIAKCYPGPGLRAHLPAIIGYDLMAIPYTVATRRDLSGVRGRLAALRNLGPILVDRHRLHVTFPDGWARTRDWMEPFASPAETFSRYARLRQILARRPPSPGR